jgi:hypothetical protein
MFTLAVLEKVLPAGTGTGRLQEGNLTTAGAVRGRVTIELLFDPPRHVRLPINDDEIMDRALAVQPLADKPIVTPGRQCGPGRPG